MESLAELVAAAEAEAEAEAMSDAGAGAKPKVGTSETLALIEQSRERLASSGAVLATALGTLAAASPSVPRDAAETLGQVDGKIASVAQLLMLDDVPPGDAAKGAEPGPQPRPRAPLPPSWIEQACLEVQARAKALGEKAQGGQPA